MTPTARSRAAEPGSLRSLLPTLTERLPQIITEVVELLSEEWPDYAAFLAADPEESFRIAELAIQHLVALAEQAPRRRPLAAPATAVTTDALFEEVGRIEWREGRALDSLLSAYRAGGRVTWRHLSEVAVRRGLDAATTATLAEAVFAFIEELSSASARGYVDEQRTTAAERERLRSQLGDLLISDRSDSTLVRATALRAGWSVPSRAAIVLIDPDQEQAAAQLDRLDPRALPVRRAGLLGAVLPDPDAPARHRTVAEVLAGCRAVVGPGVPPEQLPASLRVTEAALRLLRTGRLPDPPLFVAEHFDAILVARDDWLHERIRDQELAPLAGLPSAVRQRLEQTLAAWLLSMGRHQDAAAALNVHPQTVRYRMRQLRERFGDRLDDPDCRRRLMLAVCWPPPPR
ncbi:MAG TPA: helix-turn-helix domain-containing protein [Mycobacteriales bacterium]|nr:helix-turn-helix domain-containing protein [Mycobacteriales bacterium]